MPAPLVSVIIPTFNGADHLIEAIESVLNQTYTSFELIVVNDASPDNTHEVIKRFSDPRLEYICHEHNLGAVAARKTALERSKGKYVAFLDQDDLFHPHKLETHVSFLENHPEIGVTFNGRFDIGHSAEDIFRVWQPPTEVDLAAMILGFPFAPSDTVFRRNWALREDIWDYRVLHGSEVVVNGGEYVYCGRLWFAGCRFANVRRTLNYRRFHMGRVFSNLNLRCESELACQRIVFDDPRCPAAISVLSNLAFSNTYLVYAYYAYAQGETKIGRDYVAEAYRLAPDIIAGTPSHLVEFMIANSINDNGRNHEVTLYAFFANLPDGLSDIARQQEQAIARSYLLKASNQLIWGHIEHGNHSMSRAVDLGAELDDRYFQNVTYQIHASEREFGVSVASRMIENLRTALKAAFGSRSARKLLGCYHVNQAFDSYSCKSYLNVLTNVGSAIANDAKYLRDRGVWAISARSCLGMLGFDKSIVDGASTQRHRAAR